MSNVQRITKQSCRAEACQAKAALWNTAWSGATYTSIADPDAGGGGALNITQLECIHGTDGSGLGYYFRMTLAAGGALDDTAYMLNFNTDGNLGTGANAGTSTYIATGMTGIDKIVDTHYDGGFGSSHYHVYNGALPNDIKFSLVTLSDAGGAAEQSAANVLEWYVPDALLSANTTVRGSIVNIGTTFGDPNPTVTHDITGIMVIPEPTSLALLALGVAAIGLRRKLRA